uniref:Actin-related protein 6 n=1 Tax=Rhabditophanes sp. KR3021 TaxID=114890 RepID=A0AC35TQ23_9BILA
MNQPNLFILDNGASTIKAGFSTSSTPKIITNAIIKCKSDRNRLYIGAQVDELTDKSALFCNIPCERGYIMDYNIQYQIWDQMWGPECFNIDFANTNLVLTDANLNVPAIKNCNLEVMYEYYGFGGLLETSASSLVASDRLWQQNKKACLVVDTGYSFTHILPYVDGKLLLSNVVRIDIGGKALTNQLCELISYRQIDVSEEKYIMDDVKIKCCYVPQNFLKDLAICELKTKENLIRRTYVMPDFVDNLHGIILLPNQPKPPSYSNNQTITLNNERFSIPELLFNPSDIEVNQKGIADALADCLNQMKLPYQSALFGNINVVGGCALFEGFEERLKNDVRSQCDPNIKMDIHIPENAITEAWCCGQRNGDKLSEKVVTKAFYDDQGSDRVDKCMKQFWHHSALP